MIVVGRNHDWRSSDRYRTFMSTRNPHPHHAYLVDEISTPRRVYQIAGLMIWTEPSLISNVRLGQLAVQLESLCRVSRRTLGFSVGQFSGPGSRSTSNDFHYGQSITQCSRPYYTIHSIFLRLPSDLSPSGSLHGPYHCLNIDQGDHRKP